MTPLTATVTASLPPAGPKLIATADIKITSSHKEKSLSLGQLLQKLKCKCHYINGDGSCLYHAVAHRAGLIDKTSKGDIFISGQLRQLVVNMMTKHPGVREEDGLSLVQWFQKMVLVPDLSSWGGDLELCLLAIGLSRDIMVITVAANDSVYARHLK